MVARSRPGHWPRPAQQVDPTACRLRPSAAPSPHNSGSALPKGGATPCALPPGPVPCTCRIDDDDEREE